MAGELSARIGSNFSDYVGDPQLGGATGQVFDIKTRPFENLAAYTFAYKTKLYDQKQKDLVERAKELASFTEYDLTNAVPKYGEQIRTKFSELKDWVVNNMDVLDYNNNPKGFLEYKKRRNELDNDIRDGKVQEILYAGATSAAEAETNPAMKAFLLKQRDQQVEANDIRTPLVINKYDVVKPITKAPPLKEFDITIQEGDFKADRKLSKIDMKSLNAQAFALGLGLAGDVLNENDPNFINLPEDVKKLKREEYKAKQSSGRLSTIDEAQTYNEAISKYKDKEGNIDLDKLKFNPILFPLIERFNKFNKYMIDEKANIKAGNYKDKGIALQFGMNGLDEADYQEVSFLDGVTPEELLKVEIFSKAPPEKYETTVDATDNAFQREELRLRWANFGLDKEKLNKADTQDLLAADGILREITDIINKGDMPDNQVDVVDGNTGKKKRVFKIGDPTILQKFGNIDKDGKTTNVPDEARYNPKTNEIDLVYFQRDELGNPKPTQTRGNYIKEQKTLNARTWANMVTQRTFSGNNKGDVNEIIQSVITKNGGDLYKIAKALSGGTITPQTTQVQGTSSSSSSSSVKLSGKVNTDSLKTGQVYEVNGKTYIWNGTKLKAQ